MTDLPIGAKGAISAVANPGTATGKAFRAILLSLLMLGDSSGGGGGISGTLFVSPTGDPATAARGTFNAFQTIQAAVTAALSGDVIYISPGTYAEAIVLPRRNVTLQGLSRGSVFIASPDPSITIRLAAGAPTTLTSIAFENLSILNPSGNDAITFGDGSAVLFGATTPGVQVRNCVVGKTTFTNLGHLTIDGSTIALLNTNGIDALDVNNCVIKQHNDHYKDSAFPLGSSDSRVRRYTNCCFQNPAGITAPVNFYGCSIVKMDDSNIIRGVLYAEMTSNATIGVDPLLILAPTIRPYNAPYGSGVLLNIAFPGGAPYQTGSGSLNPGGFDLSGIRVYGDTLMSFSQALGSPLNSQYVQFQGIGCMFENGLTATFFGSGSQYLVKFRASTFGFSAQSTIGSGVHVVANNNGDLDLRGCNLSNCDLGVSGNAGIDRDCLVTTDVTLGSSGSVGIFPPLPSYVTGFAAGNGYAVATAVDDELAGQIGIKGTSNYNHVDYTFTTLGTPVKGQFTITRQPNPSS